MLDLFQNTALINTLFQFLTGKPLKGMSGDETTINKTRSKRYLDRSRCSDESSTSPSKLLSNSISFAFNKNGIGFKFKRTMT
jgi:hypothetical protein